MNNGLLLAVITAVGFGAWPIVGRLAGANRFWMILAVMIPTIILTSWAERDGFPEFPSWKASAMLVACGIANGVSMLTATAIILEKNLDLSAIFPIVNVAIVTVSALSGIFFLNEAVTASKTVGLVCACAAAWLLSR